MLDGRGPGLQSDRSEDGQGRQVAAAAGKPLPSAIMSNNNRRGFSLDGVTAMPKDFKIGDRVRWNSEAGLVSGVIIRKFTADTNFKGYTHHASRESPQYLIQSDKTDHIAIHKGSALRLIPGRARKSNKAKGKKRKG
jgi:hypothetical protein